MNQNRKTHRSRSLAKITRTFGGSAAGIHSICEYGIIFFLYLVVGIFGCYQVSVAQVELEAGQEDLETGRVIEVSTDEQLDLAIQEARPGDRIQIADGRYQGIEFLGVRGTDEHPIVIAAKTPRMAVIEGSRSGRNARLSACEFIDFEGLRFTNGKVWGVTLGPKSTDASTGEGACSRIRFINCEFDHAGQELLKINGGSQYISVIGCDFHHSGMKQSGTSPYAEGVYIGEGATLTDRTHDILILNNHFYSIGNERNGGEAIDVKRQAYRIQIIDNTIEDVVVYSGGAITVLIDPVDYPADATNPEVIVIGNRIRNVRKHPEGWTGGGICIGSNGVLVYRNEVSETEGPAFLVYTNAANTTGNVWVDRNVFQGDVLINQYGLRESDSPVAVDLKDNQVGVE
jgi:hypothetical protein